ncbi:MAG: hypothetical protein IPK77_11495 [Cellvibrio sp.]|nr:hypothetical protein [Cellvibrio sp.]
MQRSYNLIRELSKYHDVTLLAFNQQAIIPKEKIPGAVEHFKVFCKCVEIFDIASENSTFLKIFALIRGLFLGNTYNTIWLESSEYERRLTEKLQQEKFDLIHVDTISLVPFVKNLNHLKRSLNHHNIESLMM